MAINDRKAAGTLQDNSRQENVFPSIITAITVGSIILSVMAILSAWWPTLLLTAIVFFTSVVCLILFRLKYNRAAQTLAAFVLLGAAVYSTYIGNGIHDVAVALFPVAIIIASVMLQPGLYTVYTIAAVLAVSAVGFLKWEGLPGKFVGSEDFRELFVLAAIFIVAAIASQSLVRIFLRSFDKARRSEEKYRSIYEHVQDMYYETSFDGLLIETNRAGEKLLGGTRNEIIGKPVEPYYVDLSERTSILTDLERSGSVTNYEFKLRDLSGSIHLVSLSASILDDVNKKERLIVGSIRDITDHKNVEEQLQHVQKMESIGALTGGIAHDFNNLLTVINGHCELALLDIGGTDDEIEHNVNAIHAAGKRAADLIAQLLAFSRKQAFEPQAIDINRLINELNQIIHTLVGESIALEVYLKEVPNIQADPSQVEQIILNLLVNARDALNESGKMNGKPTIRLETSFVRYTPADETLPGGNGGQDCIKLTIQDNGIGMDEETMNRVFEPFFSNKDNGTGLGLSTVYGIVKQNNGDITIKSRPGEGTTFDIYWPATAAEAAVSETGPVINLQGNECILLAEDDDGVRSFVKNSLNSYGYTVFDAANGKKAMGLDESILESIDLLVTDVIMPELGGKDLAETLARKNPGLQVLYISGHAEDHITHDGIIDSGINFLKKPFSVRQLLEKAREILDQD